MWWQWLLGFFGLLAVLFSNFVTMWVTAKVIRGEPLELKQKLGRQHFRTEADEARIEAEQQEKKRMRLIDKMGGK
jgi:hypothetical protein